MESISVPHFNTLNFSDQEKVAAESNHRHDGDENKGGLEVTVAGQPTDNGGHRGSRQISEEIKTQAMEASPLPKKAMVINRMMSGVLSV